MNLSLSPPQQNSVTADGLLVTTRLPNQNLKRMNPDSLWAQLPAKMDRQGNLFDVTIGRFRRCGESFSLRKLVFIGPWAGNSPWLRLGVFAGLHGDEPSGVYALMKLALELHEAPELARGLEIHFYPLCNPSGFVDNTRSLRGGTDMNREFWRNSCEPEVQLLEKELSGLLFGGLVSLHSDDTSDGIYGYVGGDVLTKNLLEPALQAASEFIPRNTSRVIDGFNADKAIIEEGFSGMLSAPSWQQPKPFEIVFETPASIDECRQILSHRAALMAVFDAALALKSHAAGI